MLTFDDKGLIAAIAQDALTGEVRMLGWMNQEAVAATLQSGNATFFSRSRGRLWVKGESSGHFLKVRSVVTDCDADTLLLLVDPSGPTCHTGKPNCFFRRVEADGNFVDMPVEAAPFLMDLEETLKARQSSTAEKSYTRSLLDAGPSKIAAKLREEAAELGVALESESDERVASEASDLLYHMLVGLRSRGIPLRAVIEVLASRTHQSGHAEKNSRKA
jgi:phosphoribosyl-ATP pyrophosphohydrolase/phosphoribosyl-AMP cyclohydrolase